MARLSECPDWLAKDLAKARAEGRLKEVMVVSPTTAPFNPTSCGGYATPPPPNAQCHERTYQVWVRRVFTDTGWLFYHTHQSRKSDPGFPDVVAIHPASSTGIAAELKSSTGRLTEAQTVWLEAFRRTGWRTFVWKPVDHEEVLRVARRV